MHLLTFGLAIMLAVPSSAFAEAPTIQAPTPLIHLADNLDEADRLGWCIDTQGRGFNEQLHAHSCKPRGGDVQFSHSAETGLIRSVAYPEFCMNYDPNQTSALSLVSCDAGVEGQAFEHNVAGTITLAGEPTLCLAVGTASASAGPYMSRALEMRICAETPDKFKIWVVLP